MKPMFLEIALSHGQAMAIGRDHAHDAGGTFEERSVEMKPRFVAMPSSAAPSKGADHFGILLARAPLAREVLPVRAGDTRIGWFLQRCFIPIIVSAAVMVVAHLWAHQIATRRVLWISTPTPVPWMCENRGHVWQRCSWVEDISAARSQRADLVEQDDGEDR